MYRFELPCGTAVQGSPLSIRIVDKQSFVCIPESQAARSHRAVEITDRALAHEPMLSSIMRTKNTAITVTEPNVVVTDFIRRIVSVLVGKQGRKIGLRNSFPSGACVGCRVNFKIAVFRIADYDSIIGIKKMNEIGERIPRSKSLTIQVVPPSLVM